MLYVVSKGHGLWHAGKAYGPGVEVDIPDDAAERLVDEGVIEELQCFGDCGECDASKSELEKYEEAEMQLAVVQAIAGTVDNESPRDRILRLSHMLSAQAAVLERASTPERIAEAQIEYQQVREEFEAAVRESIGLPEAPVIETEVEDESGEAEEAVEPVEEDTVGDVGGEPAESEVPSLDDLVSEIVAETQKPGRKPRGKK